MGFDISYHPVDKSLIQERLLPFIRGETQIDDLAQEAARIARLRFRAKSWGLGVLGLSHEQSDEDRKRKGKKSQGPRVPDAFDSDLHVWGRPFFITDELPGDVSASIDRYLCSTPQGIDRLAREMIARLEPGLVERVARDEEGTLPQGKALLQDRRWKMDLLRDAFAAWKKKQPQVELPDGESMSPRELFQSSFLLACVEFAANLRPGWMARGYVWPTCLLDEARLPWRDLFESPAALIEPLRKEMRLDKKAFEPIIVQNYMVGGYLPAKRVPDALALLEDKEDKILKWPKKENWEPEARVALRKIREALEDARLRGLGFVEAAEIYSAPMGIMN